LTTLLHSLNCSLAFASFGFFLTTTFQSLTASLWWRMAVFATARR
jgi:hypothetical protein